MRARVLGSSSKGNCYLLESGAETLILEAGIRWKEIQKGLGFDLAPVVGCLVTHEHGDHAKAVADAVKAGIDLYATAGTVEALGLSGHRVHRIQYQTPFKVGAFEALAFDVDHDASEPAGFLIRHPDMGTLLFATDACGIRHRFTELNHVWIECNYSDAILERATAMPEAARNRLVKTHMSLEKSMEFLKNAGVDANSTRTIAMLHLSDGNSDARTFQNKIWLQTGIRPVVADAGVDIDVGLYPF